MANNSKMTKEQIEEEKVNGWKRELERLKRREMVYRSRYGDNIPENIIVDEEKFWREKWSKDKIISLRKERREIVTRQFAEFFGADARIIKGRRELESQGIIWGYKESDFHQDTINNILDNYSFTKLNGYEICKFDNNLPYFYIREGRPGELVVAFHAGSDEEYYRCVEFMTEIYRLYDCEIPQAIMLASKGYVGDSKFDIKYGYDGKFLISITDNSLFGADSFVDYCRNRVFDNIASYSEDYIKLLTSKSNLYYEDGLRNNLQRRINDNGTEKNLYKLQFAREYCENILNKHHTEVM